MSWSSRLRSYLSQPEVRPQWILESIKLGTDWLTGDWRIASSAGLGGPVLIAPGGVQTSAEEVTLRTWAVTSGAWSVRLAGDDRFLLSRLQRGQIVILRIGFPGWRAEEYETVTAGQVWQYGGPPGARVLQMRSLLGVLLHRPTTDGTELDLFHSIPTATTVAAGYSAGDPTLDVASTSGFQRQGGPAQSLKGAIKVTPTSGSDFYLTYTGTAGGNQFTGCSATAILGTTAANSDSPKPVVEVMYMDDHPAAAAARVLRSTGAFDTTGYDTLPAAWGYRLPASLVDDVDIGNTIAVTGTATNSWDVFAEAPVDGGTWLSEMLAPAGMWLTTRQGRLTVRAIQDPYNTPKWTGIQITEDDIADLEWYAWSSTTPLEYYQCSVNPASGFGFASTDGGIGTQPASDDLNYRILYDYSAGADAADEAGPRMAPWVCRVPEEVSLTCRGWRLAALAPGDVVEVSHRLLQGRRGDVPYSQQRAVVTSVAPDWARASTRLRLAVLPSWSGGLP